jgi:acetyl-CoA synthetase
VCENERAERQVIIYAQLRHQVRQTAAALRGLGIGKGDRVGIYMPTRAEAIILMPAIGATIT